MVGNLIAGVISGLVATISFSIFLVFIRPKLLLSNKICKAFNEPGVYRIKIVNKSKAVLNNLYYALYYCRDAGDGIKEIEEIQPIKTKLSFINKYYYFKKIDDYAVRISYNLDESKYPLGGNAYLEFNVMATHSLSNTMRCFKQVYTSQDILEGIFESGKSTKILASAGFSGRSDVGVSS